MSHSIINGCGLIAYNAIRYLGDNIFKGYLRSKNQVEKKIIFLKILYIRVGRFWKVHLYI
jgi:hypothetical protein